MKFSKEIRTGQASYPNDPQNRPPQEIVGLAKLDEVAQHLRISKRCVQSLVRRKVIPVIRIGKRCTRFNLTKVIAAIERYEIQEYRLK